MHDEFKIRFQDSFNKAEAEDAKKHWRKTKFEFYKEKQEWSVFMADRILNFEPRSVFEFGCNAGRNLIEIKEKGPKIFVSGIDINREAIKYGRSIGLNIAVGDETVLEVIPNESFDIVFTISVLDHLPYPSEPLENLARISKKGTLLLEPWLGEEGKIVRNRDTRTGKMVDTTPFSYSWDYVRLAQENLPRWSIVFEDYKIPTNTGKFYNLYTITPE